MTLPQCAMMYLLTFLGFFAHIPVRIEQRIDARLDYIAERLEASEEQHGVPYSVMLVVSFAETHIGQDDGEGGNWGAPESRTNRHAPGTPLQAARALAWSYRVCGNDWRRAVARFRSGLCVPWKRDHQQYVEMISRHVRRLHAELHDPLPAGF